MKNRNAPSSRTIITKINNLIEATDIRILVYAPPIVGCVSFLVGIFLMNILTNGNPYRSVTYILVGSLSLLLCFSGYAEIYKKEMPGPLGGIYRGKLAIISGAFTIIVFGSLGAVLLIYGISTLLS